MDPRFFRPQRLSLAQHILRMEVLHPQFRHTWKAERVVWVGPITAAGMVREYQIRIAYRLKDSPAVHVEHPHLQNRGEAPIPHVYPGNRLCLYLPGSGEWSPKLFIAETIVPWTSLWLYYYEVWHATGEWLGGGVHPQSKEEKHRKSA